MIGRRITAAERVDIESTHVQVVINRGRQNDDDSLSAFERDQEQEILIRLPNEYRQLTEAVTLGMPLIGSVKNPLTARYCDLGVWFASENGPASEVPSGSCDTPSAECHVGMNRS